MPTWFSSETAIKGAESYVYRPAPAPVQEGRGEYLPESAPPWLPLSGPTEGANVISEEAAQAREKRAWDLGFEQGQAQSHAEFEKVMTQQREAVARALRDFADERRHYYQKVETEVVRLALAIARKILHREAQIDPLLLAGVVRVALERVAAGTAVKLRVHPSHIGVWREFFGQQPDLQPTPELLGDASLAPDQSVLETVLGSTELTLASQLKEVEQGFFDLLAQRPE